MATKMLGKVVAGAALGGASLLVFTPGIAFADGSHHTDGHHDKGKVIAKPHVVKPGHKVNLIEICTEAQEYPFVWSKVTGKVKLSPKHDDKKDEGKKDEGKWDEGKKDEGKKDEGKKDEGKWDDKKDEGKWDDKKDEGKKYEEGNWSSEAPSAENGSGIAAPSYEHDSEYRAWKESAEYREFLEYKHKKEGASVEEGTTTESGAATEAGTATEKGATTENGAPETTTQAGENGQGGGAADDAERKDWEGKDAEKKDDEKKEWENSDGKEWEKEKFVYWASVKIPWDAKPGKYELKGSCGEGELVVLPKGSVDGGDGGVTGTGTETGLAAGGAAALGAAALGGIVLMRRRRIDATLS